MKLPEWSVTPTLYIAYLVRAAARGAKKTLVLGWRLNALLCTSLIATGAATVIGVIVTAISYDRAVAIGSRHEEMYSVMAYCALGATFLAFSLFTIAFITRPSDSTAVVETN